MDVKRLSDHPSFSLTMENPAIPPDSQLQGCHHVGVCCSSSENKSQLAVDTPGPNESVLEDARLILGCNVDFTIGPNDDSFDAQEYVEGLTSVPANSTNPVSTVNICIPHNKITNFNEAMREHLARRSRQTVESAGRISFWKGSEPFMRPLLSRSLSLP